MQSNYRKHLLFFSWLFINSLSYINTGPYEFILGQWEKLEASDKQNNALRWTIQQYTQLYYCITSSLASITFNHRLGHRASGSQILSRGSIKYTRFTLYYSWHDLITGTSILRPKLWNPVSSGKRMGLENWPRFRGCTPQPHPSARICQVLRLWPPPPQPTLLNLPLCMNFPRYGVRDALPRPCLRTCIPFTYFSLVPSLRKGIRSLFLKQFVSTFTQRPLWLTWATMCTYRVQTFNFFQNLEQFQLFSVHSRIESLNKVWPRWTQDG